MNNTKGKERRDNKSRRLCLLHKKDKEYLSKFAVVPHAGTWIEIIYESSIILLVGSFPTRERGLKYQIKYCHSYINPVVPHAGTWIEIVIDISGNTKTTSFPTRERGLKYRITEFGEMLRSVVPHAGTWIEILQAIFQCSSHLSFPTRERGLKLEL